MRRENGGDVMSNSKYYQDKICIVTGANSGIGYALSEELLKRGALFTWLAVTRKRLQKLRTTFRI
jgi:NAD(P)-dependent dehydrogenase (short-subunit alcohol dehydrogenase family)